MSSRGEETRDKILLAAIECIETLGVMGTTVRAIARRAGVNVAAVNYHFGSKEALIAGAFDRALEHFFEDLDALLNRDYSDVNEGLRDLFRYLLDGVTRYGGISRAQLSAPFLDGNCDRPFVNRFMRFLGQFQSKLDTLPGSPGAEKIGIRLEHGVSVLFFRAMIPCLFQAFSRGHAPEADKYVADLLWEGRVQEAK